MTGSHMAFLSSHTINQPIKISTCYENFSSQKD